MIKIKRENVNISFESEKIKALKKYLDKKNINFQEEMYIQVKKLYEKYVPISVCEYIDETDFRDENNTKKVTKNKDINRDKNNQENSENNKKL